MELMGYFFLKEMYVIIPGLNSLGRRLLPGIEYNPANIPIRLSSHPPDTSDDVYFPIESYMNSPVIVWLRNGNILFVQELNPYATLSYVLSNHDNSFPDQEVIYYVRMLPIPREYPPYVIYFRLKNRIGWTYNSMLDENKKQLYFDLDKEVASSSHNMNVVCPVEFNYPKQVNDPLVIIWQSARSRLYLYNILTGELYDILDDVVNPWNRADRATFYGELTPEEENNFRSSFRFERTRDYPPNLYGRTPTVSMKRINRDQVSQLDIVRVEPTTGGEIILTLDRKKYFLPT